MKKHKKRAIVAGAILAMIAGVFIILSSSGKTPIRVERKTLTQEIIAQGAVEATQKIDLAFETEGSVKSIAVKPGDAVAFGAILAILDARQLDAQREHLEAVIQLDRARFTQLLTGVPKEDVALARAKADAARSVMDAAQRLFQSSKMKSDAELAALYATAAEYANTVVLNADNAMKALVSVYDERNQFRNFLAIPDSKEKTDAQWQMIFARSAFENIKARADGLKTDPSSDLIDRAISDFKTNLEVIRSLLGKTAGALDSAVILLGSPDIGAYRTTFAVQRSVLNETQSALLRAEQDAAAQKAFGEAAVASAKNAVEQASVALKLAEDELALTASASGAGARSLLQAQIKESESSLAVLRQKIEDTTLRAPAAGIVQGIRIASGGFVKAHIPVVSFIPLADLEIQVDLDPNQAALVKAGDPAVISSGTLKTNGMVSGVQGSRAMVYFQNADDTWHLQSDAEVRMTVTLKQNALIVPQEFIREENGVKKLIVIEKTGKKERIVLTGVVWGSEIEITEGVLEGELLAR